MDIVDKLVPHFLPRMELRECLLARTVRINGTARSFLAFLRDPHSKKRATSNEQQDSNTCLLSFLQVAMLTGELFETGIET